MSDVIIQGQFKKFLTKSHFVPKGKKHNRYVGILDGTPRIITFPYHKGKDIIHSGTLSAFARQLEISKQELINKIKKLLNKLLK